MLRSNARFALRQIVCNCFQREISCSNSRRKNWRSRSACDLRVTSSGVESLLGVAVRSVAESAGVSALADRGLGGVFSCSYVGRGTTAISGEFPLVGVAFILRFPVGGLVESRPRKGHDQTSGRGSD